MCLESSTKLLVLPYYGRSKLSLNFTPITLTVKYDAYKDFQED